MKYTILSTNHKKLTLTDNGIIISREKTMFNAGWEKLIPYKQVISVQLRPCGKFLNGFIQIQIAGQPSPNHSANSSASESLNSALNDENSIVYAKEMEERAQKIYNFLNKKISENL
ncbi:hypothetical protein [Allofournierella sp.]|uniref:hypothetical protein n=1 Tax=Allofournierella sp. TaxID=1940256 RepID=UPI003AF0E66C